MYVLMYLDTLGRIDYVQGETFEIINMRIKDAWLADVIDQEWWDNGDYKLTKIVGGTLQVVGQYRCDMVPLISVS